MQSVYHFMFEMNELPEKKESNANPEGDAALCNKYHFLFVFLF
jgi:hypothetical protein